MPTPAPKLDLLNIDDQLSDEERLLRDEVVRELRAASVAGGVPAFNEDKFTAGEADIDAIISAARRSNYAFREAALAMRATSAGGPAVGLMHGANPGLVSHFVKQAMLDVAGASGL